MAEYVSLTHAQMARQICQVLNEVFDSGNRIHNADRRLLIDSDSGVDVVAAGFAGVIHALLALDPTLPPTEPYEWTFGA